MNDPIGSKAYREWAYGPEAKTVSAPVNELNVTLGNLVILASQPSFVGSTILLDGKPLAVRSLKLEGDLNGVWTVTMEYFPHLHGRLPS